MKAIEFKTRINQGIVEIPLNYQKELGEEQTVRVIILAEDTPTNEIDEIDYLMDNPIKVAEIAPLKRDEIYN